MTYEEFVTRSVKSPEYYMDMVRLVEIKTKHRMTLTDDERELNTHILSFQENAKLNELRDRFEKCLEIEDE